MDSVVDSSFANLSILHLTKEELEVEYNKVKKLYSEAVASIEDKSQQIYDYKRQLSTAVALEKEYLGEIDALQAEDKTESKKLSENVINLEEELKSIKVLHSEQIQIFEELLSKKDAEIEELENNLKLVVESTSGIDNAKEIENLSSENAALKAEMFELKCQLDNDEQNLESLQKSNYHFEETLSQIKNEYKQLEENYSLKKEEIIEKNNLIETLQDELAITKNELDLLKSRPLEQGSRGNSLFAEVDDRRVQLMKEMTFMKTKFKEMKREKAEHLKEITQLRLENSKLLQKYRDEIVEKQQDDQMLLRTHNTRIQTLEILLENYQKELKTNPIKYEGVNFSVEELKFVQDMIDRKSEEFEEIRQHINYHSLSQMMLTSELREVKAEVRAWRATAMEYKHEIGVLKDTIEQMKLNDKEVVSDPVPMRLLHNNVQLKKEGALQSPDPFRFMQKQSCFKIKPNPPIFSIAEEIDLRTEKEDTCNADKQNEQDKENLKSDNVVVRSEKVAKTVTFSQDTKRDSNVTRRRGKILEYKTLFVPNKK